MRWPIGEEIRFDGSVHPLVAALPHHGKIPKGEAQIEWRLNIRRWAHNRKDRQEWIRQQCAADPLFFVNAFCWLVEPRDQGKLPFDTWVHQDVWFAATAHYSGWTAKKYQRDMATRKSRAQGASWGVAAEFVRAFLFRKNCYQGFVSKDEDTADNPTNPNSFGWKIDFLIDHLPGWMKPPGCCLGGPHRKVTDHTWFNPLNGSYMMAEAATGTGFRAGRLWRAFEDEAAFFPLGRDAAFWENLRAVTDCRIAASTPNGQENKFYDIVHQPSSILQLVLHWQDNPDQRPGLYTTEHGRLKLLDREYKFPPDYPFVLDGRIRSPWYDAECERASGNIMEIARELDIDFGGSKGRPFPEPSLAEARKYTREPVRRGMFDYLVSDPSAYKETSWMDGDGYPFKLWEPLDSQGLLPVDEYVVGCDVGAGTGGDGSSNSALAIFNGRGEQVGEYADNTISPENFAQLSVAICYWLGRGGTTPFLIWEKNGPAGTQFTKEVMRLDYPHVYYQKDDEQRGSKRTQRPGFHNTKTSKALGPLAAALNNRQVVLRSKDLLRECSEYVFGKSDWEHPKSKKNSDASLEGVNHGDRAIAAAMCVHGLRDRRMLPEIELRARKKLTESQAPPDSVFGRAKRQRAYEESRMMATSCDW